MYSSMNTFTMKRENLMAAESELAWGAAHHPTEVALNTAHSSPPPPSAPTSSRFYPSERRPNLTRGSKCARPHVHFRTPTRFHIALRRLWREQMKHIQALCSVNISRMEAAATIPVLLYQRRRRRVGGRRKAQYF